MNQKPRLDITNPPDDWTAISEGRRGDAEILIGDPASIARETERLAATIAANLRQYGRLKRAARNFGQKLAREPRVPLAVLEAWRAVDEVLQEIRESGPGVATSEEVEAGW